MINSSTELLGDEVKKARSACLARETSASSTAAPQTQFHTRPSRVRQQPHRKRHPAHQAWPQKTTCSSAANTPAGAARSSTASSSKSAGTERIPSPASSGSSKIICTTSPRKNSRPYCPPTESKPAQPPVKPSRAGLHKCHSRQTSDKKCQRGPVDRLR